MSRRKYPQCKNFLFVSEVAKKILKDGIEEEMKQFNLNFNKQVTTLLQIIASVFVNSQQRYSIFEKKTLYELWIFPLFFHTFLYHLTILLLRYFNSNLYHLTILLLHYFNSNLYHLTILLLHYFNLISFYHFGTGRKLQLLGINLEI